MKKKIVIRVQVTSGKCSSKALQIAAAAPGVTSVAFDADDREKIVVIGEVDAFCLANILKKKFKCVIIVSVEDVKKPEEKKPEEKCELICCKLAEEGTLICCKPKGKCKTEEKCKLICCKPLPCPPPTRPCRRPSSCGLCPTQPCRTCPPPPCSKPSHRGCDEQYSDCFVM